METTVEEMLVKNSLSPLKQVCRSAFPLKTGRPNLKREVFGKMK